MPRFFTGSAGGTGSLKFKVCGRCGVVWITLRREGTCKCQEFGDQYYGCFVWWVLTLRIVGCVCI